MTSFLPGPRTPAGDMTSFLRFTERPLSSKVKPVEPDGLRNRAGDVRGYPDAEEGREPMPLVYK